MTFGQGALRIFPLCTFLELLIDDLRLLEGYKYGKHQTGKHAYAYVRSIICVSLEIGNRNDRPRENMVGVNMVLA